MSALRVLFVIPGLAEGSSMIFARRQAESLTRQGVEVDLFHLRSRTSLPELIREWRRFRRRLRRVNPQVIHAHFGTVTACFAAWGATFAIPGRPLVITYRGSDLNPVAQGVGWRARLRAAAGRALSQLAALRADRIVCVSSRLRQRLWWRRGNAVVLPSGVDTEVFRPEPRERVRARLGWSAAERVVLFNAGNNPALKRLDLARKAVGLAGDLLDGVRLEVLDGRRRPDQVPELLNGADCLLLTSDQEGSPTILQEALACNLPVVSVDTGDCASRLAGVQYCSIVAREPGAIAAELARALETPVRSNGRDKVREFSSQRIAGELRRIYLELGAGAERTPAGTRAQASRGAR
ncbi:MAG: glycosyltransferase family 4 protein [Acidobacteriota bacterium]